MLYRETDMRATVRQTNRIACTAEKGFLARVLSADLASATLLRPKNHFACALSPS